MDGIAHKRPRYDDLESFAPQRKKHINERLVDEQRTDVMSGIYEKTINLLFNAARANKSTLSSTLPTTSASAAAVPLWEQIILSGNGEISTRNVNDLTSDLSAQRQKWGCCNRQVYICSNCINCGHKLCEYCGHSCAECGSFLCDCCVSLFGCGNTERPICDKCALFQGAA